MWRGRGISRLPTPTELSMLRIAVLAAALLAASAAHAGDFGPKATNEVVDQLIAGMDTYVDPQVAKAVQARLRAHRGQYAQLGDRAAFAEAVNRDLLEVGHDKHVRVSLATVEAGQGARLTPEQQALVDR